MSAKNQSERLLRFLILILPLVLFFSYYPLIHFGADESMNFEISLPIIWLVVFDIVAFVRLARKKMLGRIWQNWLWLLLPVFLTLSIFWSLNSLRGFLTVGIIWLIYFAVFSMFCLRDLITGENFKKKFLKTFLISTSIVCLWCFVQCILDLAGVSREYSLMCAGCTYKMFGFPRPNGFAIEPQFMGNLMLAPTILAIWLILGKQKLIGRKVLFVYLLIFVMTLFLTMSRGAIYALIVAMIFMTVVKVVQTRKSQAFLIWPIMLLAFIGSLGLQGLMAEFSKTDDTFRAGVAKVLNHLSLGVIDIRGEGEVGSVEEVSSGEGFDEEGNNEAIFDGYVAESTDTRLRLSDAAIKVWLKNWKTTLFGVGLGGAGTALYVNELSPAPKEIIQNEYFSLLLETGVVGVLLATLTVVWAVRYIIKKENYLLVLTLMAAYGVSLGFFAGLPNALQIYLMTPLILAIYSSKSRRKKLVS